MSQSVSIQRETIQSGELYRKFLHMLPGIFPFTLTAVPHPDPIEFFSIAVVVSVCVILTAIFLLGYNLVRRPGESNLLSSVFSYSFTILLTLILFRHHLEFTLVVVIILSFGDGMACIGGKLFGRRALPWNPKKTWAGTICFVLAAGPLASLAYWNEASPTVPFAMALLCGVTAAICSALVESIPARVTDNLRVGIAAAVTVAATHYATIDWFLT